jgi:hypothetical protein
MPSGSKKRSPDEKIKTSLYVPRGLWDWLGHFIIEEGRGRDKSAVVVDLLQKLRTRSGHERAAQVQP